MMWTILQIHSMSLALVPWTARCGGRCDEWHVDLEKTVTLGRLGSYPVCPDSSKKPDLRAIRRCNRSKLAELRCARRCGGRVGDRRAQGCPLHRPVRLHVHPTSAIAASAPEWGLGGRFLRATPRHHGRTRQPGNVHAVHGDSSHGQAEVNGLRSRFGIPWTTRCVAPGALLAAIMPDGM
jgi:hypothetical protein